MQHRKKTRKERKNFTKDERKEQVLTAFRVVLNNGDEPLMTAADIARMMHLSVSPSLRALLLEMVIEGLLQVESEPLEGQGIVKFKRWYGLKMEGGRWVTKRQSEPRSIRINHKGKSSQQEMLF